MSTIDILLVVGVIVFCFYGIYIGIRTIHDIRQKSIDKFMERRNEIRKGFELRTIVPELKLGKEEFAEIKELFSDFFERVEKEKKLMNKYVHKQGCMSLYFHYNSFNAHGKPERITALTKDYEAILQDTITAVALYRLVIDPYPILMLDEDIVSRMHDLMAESFSRSFVEKYISEEFVDRYKESKLYKGLYDYFISLPVQKEAVYALIHWQLFERKDYDRIKEQHELLSLQDLEAVDLFMSSEKIGAIILDGCIDYHCETKLIDCSLTVGDAYYAKVFEEKEDFNVSYKGNYISRVHLNHSMTYLKHNAVLDEEEKSRIVGLCKQYTSVFAQAIERLQEMMAQLSDSESSKN